MVDPWKTFRSNIDKLVADRGENGAEKLSVEVGVSYWSIIRWRNGERTPDLDSLDKLAKATGYSVDALRNHAL